MITSKNIPLFLRSISFSCKPKLIRSITPNHKCRALLLSMWHLTIGDRHCSLESLTLGDSAFQSPWPRIIYIHGAVPDLLLMVLRYVMGTRCGAKEISAYWQGFLCLTDIGCTLGKTVACRNVSSFCFPSWKRGSAGGQCWALLLATAGRLSLSRSKAVLPASGHRLRFTLRLVLPMCKIDV